MASQAAPSSVGGRLGSVVVSVAAALVIAIIADATTPLSQRSVP